MVINWAEFSDSPSYTHDLDCACEAWEEYYGL
jgi:hypothetical protein